MIDQRGELVEVEQNEDMKNIKNERALCDCVLVCVKSLNSVLHCCVNHASNKVLNSIDCFDKKMGVKSRK